MWLLFVLSSFLYLTMVSYVFSIMIFECPFGICYLFFIHNKTNDRKYQNIHILICKGSIYYGFNVWNIFSHNTLTYTENLQVKRFALAIMLKTLTYYNRHANIQLIFLCVFIRGYHHRVHYDPVSLIPTVFTTIKLQIINYLQCLTLVSSFNKYLLLLLQFGPVGYKHIEGAIQYYYALTLSKINKSQILFFGFVFLSITIKNKKHA